MNGRSVVGVMTVCAAVYFLLWYAPRIAPVKANVLMADDFTADPSVHLLSYRPLLYADLWFWNHVLGKGYLMTVMPKILAGIYSSLIAILTLDLLRRWRIPLLISSIIPVFYLSHPIVNELSLWNTIASCNLSILFILLGYWVMGDALSLRRSIPAILFMTLGVSGYQIYAGLFAVLMIGEYVIKNIYNIPFPPREAVRKTAVIIVALAIYALYVKISQSVFGLYDFGHRSFISFESAAMADFTYAKWHGMSNMFANVFQPLISFYFGVEASWRAWKWIPVGLGFLTLVISLFARRSGTDTVLFGLTPIFLPALATLILLPMNATPSGWRVCGPVLYAFSLSLVPALSLIMKSDDDTTVQRTLERQMFSKKVIVLGIAMFWIIMTFPIITYHGKLRMIANKQELLTLQAIEGFWEEKGIERGGYAVAVYPINNASLMKTFAGEKGRDIVINFNRIVSYDYSNLVKGFWPQFLMHYGYRPLSEIAEKDGINRVLKEACEKEENGSGHVKSYLKVTHLETLKLSVICR